MSRSICRHGVAAVLAGLLVLTLVVTLAVSATAASAQITMPAPSEMAGIPLPSVDLQNGSVSVRLIREVLGNNLANHPVELRVAGETRTVLTDENGRALFEGIPSSRVSVSATVEGEVLGSQEFTVPVRGGVRIMLVAGVGVGSGAGGAVESAAPVPARPGTVTLGGDTRWIVELSEEAVEVYYLLEAANNASGAVTPPEPVGFNLPAEAQGSTLLEGSSPQVRLDGSRVSVEGPFRPGLTPVNVAFVLPYSGGELTIEQRVPVAVEQVAIVVEKRGDMQLRSPQITQEREMNTATGTFLVAGGPGMDPGGILSIQLTGLPYHSRVPRTTAFVLVGLIVAWGAWASRDRQRATAAARQRQQVEGRRERLYGDLVHVETAHRAGSLAAVAYAKRREELIAQLDRVCQRLEPTTTVLSSGAGLSG